MHRTKKTALGVMIGAALAGCFWIGEQDAKAAVDTNYVFKVHRKAVTIHKVGQICCPYITFYRLRWGGTNQGLLAFPCNHPHAIVAGAEPTPRHPNDVHKGRAWFYGCKIVKFHKLRD